jgi:hypothetical protein
MYRYTHIQLNRTLTQHYYKCSMGLFTIGVPKQGKRDSRTLVGLLFANKIYLTQFEVKKIESSNLRSFT